MATCVAKGLGVYPPKASACSAEGAGGAAQANGADMRVPIARTSRAHRGEHCWKIGSYGILADYGALSDRVNYFSNFFSISTALVFSGLSSSDFL